jgi:hypothetical protein
MKIQNTEFFLLRSFRDRLAPLVGASLSKADLNKAITDAGALTLVDALEEKHGYDRVDAVCLMVSVLNELQLLNKKSD